MNEKYEYLKKEQALLYSTTIIKFLSIDLPQLAAN